MKNPKSEIQNPKQIRSPKTETGGRMTRRVLECGSPLPLFDSNRHAPPPQSARGLAQSTTWRLRLQLFCLLLLAFCLCAYAQYALDWFTLDGGGGTSTGGVYSVSGTIGQPDAGVMNGGPFTLVGGFWGIIAAAQTEGAPFLSVTRSNAAVLVSWPQPAPDWNLEWTAVLPSPTNGWTLILPPYPVSGTNNVFIEPTPVGNRFYRLRKP